MNEIISSKENKKVKQAKSLFEKKYRKLFGLTIIEGVKIIKEAINSSQVFDTVFIQNDKLAEHEHLLTKINACEVVLVNESIIKHLSTTNMEDGIIATIKTKNEKITAIETNFLVLDTIQDPGNLGAIIRTAAATNFKQIFMLNCADITSEKVIRASMGNLFYTKNIALEQNELIKLFKTSQNYELYVADMNGENIFHFNKPKTKNLGLIIGNEGNGVSEFLKQYAHKTLSIPMQNQVESLNAAVSASILMYELSK